MRPGRAVAAGAEDEYASAPAVERAIHELDTGLPVYDVRTLRETTQISRMFAVMESTFAGIFAVIALILAATGIYGVVSYRTQLRTHEIGVRVALGASRTHVLQLVLVQGLWLTVTGLAVGLVLAFGMTRFIARLLYGISPNDPATVLFVMVVPGALSVLACYSPALRSMRANPGGRHSRTLVCFACRHPAQRARAGRRSGRRATAWRTARPWPPARRHACR